MPNSKAKNVAKKHRKSRERWKAKHKASLTHAKIKAPKRKKKASIFDPKPIQQMETPPLSGASPSAVSNPTGGTPERRTASMMLFHEVKKNGG